jgi:hypothetical protein
MRFSRTRSALAPVLASALGLAAAHAAADELLLLRDGRRLVVTSLVRRAGSVVFRTTGGETFSVPEADVVSPPLSRIPFEARAELVLRDGRRIPVTSLARRGGLVLFETTRGERFSVAEDQVLAPPLDSIGQAGVPRRRAPATAPQAPPAPAPAAAPPPAPPPPAAAPEPPPFTTVASPFPDRWAVPLPGHPRGMERQWTNPYRPSVLKGDLPIAGDSVFLALGAGIELPLDVRGSPLGPGVVSAEPDDLASLGGTPQLVAAARVALRAELYQGPAGFEPKRWGLRAAAAFAARTLRVSSSDRLAGGTSESHSQLALQEASAELRLATLSPRFDHASLRAGIQPFLSDFHGLVLNDLPLGARLFGTAGGNRVRWNAAAFTLLRKDAETRLNRLERADRDLLVAGLLVRDLPLGYELGGSYHFLRDADTSGAGRPTLHYLGFTGDGRLGSTGVTHAAYHAFGTAPRPGATTDVAAWLGALEIVRPREWIRYRASFLFASGDADATDGRDQGFDSIQDLPQLAGGATGFWHRSGIALPEAGVLLKPADSLLPSLRSSKFGPSSYVNPGLVLAGVGVDMELTPMLQLRALANYLRFHRTGALAQILGQPLGSEIGFELGVSLRYRPLLNEHVILGAGAAGLRPGAGFADLEPALCASPGCASAGRLWDAYVRLELAY